MHVPRSLTLLKLYLRILLLNVGSAGRRILVIVCAPLPAVPYPITLPGHLSIQLLSQNAFQKIASTQSLTFSSLTEETI